MLWTSWGFTEIEWFTNPKIAFFSLIGFYVVPLLTLGLKWFVLAPSTLLVGRAMAETHRDSAPALWTHCISHFRFNICPQYSMTEDRFIAGPRFQMFLYFTWSSCRAFVLSCTGCSFGFWCVLVSRTHRVFWFCILFGCFAPFVRNSSGVMTRNEAEMQKKVHSWPRYVGDLAYW